MHVSHAISAPTSFSFPSYSTAPTRLSRATKSTLFSRFLTPQQHLILLTSVSLSKRGQPWLLGHLLFCSSSLSLLCLFLCPPSNVGAPLGLAGSLLTVHTLPGGTFT